MPGSFVPRALYSLPLSSLLLGTASLPIQYIPLRSPGIPGTSSGLDGLMGEEDEALIQDISPKMYVELKTHGLSIGKDGLVQWERHNEDHPRNWSLSKKSFNTFVIIFLDFFTTSISTAGSAASEQAAVQWGINSTFSVFCFTSM